MALPVGKYIRYVIKKEGAGYFTEMVCIETKAVFLNGNLMGHDNVMRPVFESYKPDFAIHFAAEQDALGLMVNQLFGGKEAFAGCTVEATET